MMNAIPNRRTTAQDPPSNVRFSDYSSLIVFKDESPSQDQDKASNRWYSSVDRALFRRELISDVNRMSGLVAANQERHGAMLAIDDIYSCIGIESFLSPDTARQLMNERRGHIRAVLREQRRHQMYRTNSTIAELLLSVVSKESSQSSQLRASELAISYRGLEE
eukprot:scaffold7726_cov267-Alexandrium_tamarense.AAC.2